MGQLGKSQGPRCHPGRPLRKKVIGTAGQLGQRLFVGAREPKTRVAVPASFQELSGQLLTGNREPSPWAPFTHQRFTKPGKLGLKFRGPTAQGKTRPGKKATGELEGPPTKKPAEIAEKPGSR